LKENAELQPFIFINAVLKGKNEKLRKCSGFLKSLTPSISVTYSKLCSISWHIYSTAFRFAN